jgi:3D (Asp-Asp-Asp) domain-containing protein
MENKEYRNHKTIGTMMLSSLLFGLIIIAFFSPSLASAEMKYCCCLAGTEDCDPSASPCQLPTVETSNKNLCSGMTEKVPPSAEMKYCCCLSGTEDCNPSASPCQLPTKETSNKNLCPGMPGSETCPIGGGTCVQGGSVPKEPTKEELQPDLTPRLQIPIPTLPQFSKILFEEKKNIISINWIAEYLVAIYKLGQIFGTIIAIAMIMMAGFMWLTSGGNQAMIGQAKDHISSAVIGLALLFGSYVILTTVNPALVRFSPIQIFLGHRNIVIVSVSGYSSEVAQTDSTPFETANGEHVHDGGVAANFLKFGTKVRFPDYRPDMIFTVNDRMNERYDTGYVDIWFASKEEALQFGRRTLKMEVIQ